ncbi:DEAD/DEAH box helicase [Bacteroides gallinarum]|uniref:DEAD/DEAH box helicase n=1 Tax=Bacteroides gallinarum TaxID=376806 RepID=UPI00039B3DA8|nr:DEAD/DEAH box helicase [Bacteroides gallinarum]
MEQSDILRNLRIEQLTPMQEAARDAYQSDKDLVLLSPTGSGKTLAFLLPLVQSLRADVQGVQAVVLVPSRELALQIETVFKSMNVPFKAMSCYGGRPAMEEHRTMKGILPTVIIGTPGRMNDHLRKQNFDARSVVTLVIDEFDKCLEFGFHDEMAEIIGQLPALRKRVLLSATDAEEIPQFAGVGGGVSGNAVSSQVVKLNFLPEETVSGRLELQKVISPGKDKLETLFRLLCTLGDSSTLVFVNYRESVERIAAYLKSKKFPCDAFHGGMEQDDRERALYKFRNGSCPVLVSTDLAARGLDIPGIDNVVHYHMPVNEEAFTHRNGRTARWEACGSSFLLLHAEERLPDYLPEEIPVLTLPEQTPKPAKPRWTTLYIGKGKKDKLNKVDIVGFLYKKGGLAREDVGQVDVKEHYAFVAVRRSKAKQLLTLLRGEKIKGMKTLIEEAR